MQEMWLQEILNPRDDKLKPGAHMRAVAEQEMTALAEPKFYLLFMQICGAVSSLLRKQLRAG